MANLGDSRVVLGKKVGNTGGVAAIQLSTEHNANIEAIRQELKELHPNEPQIVAPKHGDGRVKGIIQVISRTTFQQQKYTVFNHVFSFATLKSSFLVRFVCNVICDILFFVVLSFSNALFVVLSF